LIEAMMWGLPVVTTDWRANGEVAGSGEQLPGGICFPIGGDLVAAIATATDDAFDRREQWVAWGRRNRERYEHLYHIDVLKKNLWTYFHQDVARR
jgi:glycosyltransferase involved in cell wall biosynthesis